MHFVTQPINKLFKCNLSYIFIKIVVFRYILCITGTFYWGILEEPIIKQIIIKLDYIHSEQRRCEYL